MGMRNNAPESSYFVKKTTEQRAIFIISYQKKSWAQEVATTGIATTATIVNATHTHTYKNT